MSQQPDEDRALIQSYIASRDPLLREKIVLRYVPLVHYVLGRLGLSSSLGAEYEDAASQGLIGLVEAVDRFDPGHGAQFSTYATLRVRGRILDYLRSLDWLSRTARRRTRQIQEAAQVLWPKLGRSPTDEELAAYLQMDLPDIQQALAEAGRVIVSLDSLDDAEGEEDNSLHEQVRDRDQPEPEETYDDRELVAELVKVLEGLPERERLVLSLYYYEGLTLKEVGAVLNISESRVCQLHARAILTLRAALLELNQEPAGALRASFRLAHLRLGQCC